MLGLFRKGKISEENSEALSQNLESSMQNTITLVDNLLSWSQSQMKGFNIKPEKLQLNEITSDIVNLYSNAARQKEITIEADVSSGLELEADKNIIKLVLRNLLNNAIKFSNEGGKILVSTFSKNGLVGFSVKDTGIGIPTDYLHNLFTLGNNQKIREGTANEPGSGLGLVLCNELISSSGGAMTVESKEGNGSTFFALFPNNKS
jgi:two-component system sensor histidine kinase/response regulator